MVLIISLSEKITDNWKLYFVTYGMVIGNALFSPWFFQGVEDEICDYSRSIV